MSVMSLSVVSDKKLEKILKKGGVLVDVRDPVKFRDGTKVGAKNVTLRGISSLLHLSKDTCIVLYDAGDVNSDKDAFNKYLWQMGFTNVVTVN